MGGQPGLGGLIREAWFWWTLGVLWTSAVASLGWHGVKIGYRMITDMEARNAASSAWRIPPAPMPPLDE